MREDPTIYPVFWEKLNAFADQNKDSSYHTISYNKGFLLGEFIEITSRANLPSWKKLEMLGARLVGFSLKHRWDGKACTAEDLAEIKSLFAAMRIELMATDDYCGHPPYWVKVLKTTIEFRLFDEALSTGDLWNQWESDIRNHKAEASTFDYHFDIDSMWFLCYLGILKIAMNRVQEGVQDIKRAYELEQKIKENDPKYCAPNFLSFTSHAIIDVADVFPVDHDFGGYDEQAFRALSKGNTELVYSRIMEIKAIQ
jgi:hypothetical protein